MNEAKPVPPGTGPTPYGSEPHPTAGGNGDATAQRRPTGSRIVRGTGVVLAIICVIVAGIAVRFTDNLAFEVVRTVNLGETTELNGGRVTVTKLEAGQILSVGSYDPEHVQTSGMFLAVTVRLEAPNEEEKIGGLGDLKIHAGDYTYSSFGTNSLITVPAGYVGVARVFFEVDPDHIAGAYIELAKYETVWQVPEKVHVRLGITEANADGWAKAARDRTLDGNQSVELKALT